MRPTRVAGGAVAVAVVAGLVGWLVGREVRSPADAASETAAPNASLIGVPVEKRVLSSNVVVRGTIGAVGASEFTLPSTQIGSSDTVVVRAATRGQAIDEGDVLLEFGDRPVFVLQGDLPMYRDLAPGAKGEDVLLLENALSRLGMDPGTVDGTFDGSTSAAVKRLYESKGFEPVGRSATDQARIDELTAQAETARKAGDAATAAKAQSELDDIVARTGPSVPANEVVFASVLPAKVEQINVHRGSRIDGPVATLASSVAQVRTSVARADRNLVKVGAPAKITITDAQTTVDGKVTSIADQAGVEGAGDNRYSVIVDSPDLPADSLNADVRVDIPVRSTKGAVLAVPAAALSIDDDGDAAVDVITKGNRTRKVKVKPGLQAKGLVEITPQGGSLAAGDLVAVGRNGPSRPTTTTADGR